MTPIEQELSEIEDMARAYGKFNITFTCSEEELQKKDLFRVASGGIVIKLISFIRHQQEVIAKKDEALKYYSEAKITVQDPVNTGIEMHISDPDVAKEALALKPRESLKDGE